MNQFSQIVIISLLWLLNRLTTSANKILSIILEFILWLIQITAGSVKNGCKVLSVVDLAVMIYAPLIRLEVVSELIDKVLEYHAY